MWLVLAPQGVDSHRDSNHQADDHLLPERGDIEQVQAVADYHQHQRAHQRAADASNAACKGRTTDDDGGDRVELIAGCRLRLGRVEAP